MKIATASLAAFLIGIPASLTIAGCSTESPGAAVSEGKLASPATLVGSYQWRPDSSGEFVDFETLTLNPDDTYSATVDATLVDPGVRCIRFPCTLPETGTWSTYDEGGQTMLQVRPTGGSARTSTASPSGDVLELTRSDRTTTLFKEQPVPSACAAVLCIANSNCVEIDGEAKCVPIEN